MKTFVFLGVVFVVTCAQAAPQAASQNRPSFLEDYLNLTETLLATQQNPNSMDTLSIKIDALFEVSQYHRFNRRVYQNVFNTLGKLRFLSYRMKNSDRILLEISSLQDSFDMIFDQLNLQRDVDEIDLPSKINDMIDEFVNKYVATSVELFDNMLTQTKHLGESADKLADESSVMVGSFAENIGKCLDVPRSEFKEVYQCHQNTRGVLPGLAHHTALIGAIVKDLDQLDTLKLDGETSLRALLVQIGHERFTLLNQIQEVRNQREAERDNKDSIRSTESSEQVDD